MAPLVESLVQLHNFCIEKHDNGVILIQEKSVQNLQRTVWFSKLTGGDDAELDNININGRPTSLLGHGHHFANAESYRHNRASESTPMDCRSLMIFIAISGSISFAVSCSKRHMETKSLL